MQQFLDIRAVALVLLPCILNTVVALGEDNFEALYEMAEQFINASNSYVIPLDNSAMTETINNKTYGK